MVNGSIDDKNDKTSNRNVIQHKTTFGEHAKLSQLYQETETWEL